ncbi:MAG: hypothetical protein LBV04_10590 [Deferribacteraceae bacterium]|jgi:uncharacterized protein YlzI (FlbEa/FlbD family)|nr:hypothetical protein [Deferribacteraceae bacterium]
MYVFINPSPNLEILAKAVHNRGHSVTRVHTIEHIDKRPDELWAFIGGQHYVLTERRLSEVEPNVISVRKPLFPSFKQRKINAKLTEVNPELEAGSFQDQILLKGSLWTREIPVLEANLSYDQAIEKYQGATIVTSRVFATHTGRPVKSVGTYCISFWRTDFDIHEALGNDYFFFFDKTMRNELYRVGDELMTITAMPPSIDWLKAANPTLARFAFEKVRSFTFQQNRNPWIERMPNNTYLINDYSWQGISVRLPEAWEKAVVKVIASKKPKA